jgi:hypothetical protein
VTKEIWVDEHGRRLSPREIREIQRQLRQQAMRKHRRADFGDVFR